MSNHVLAQNRSSDLQQILYWDNIIILVSDRDKYYLRATICCSNDFILGKSFKTSCQTIQIRPTVRVTRDLRKYVILRRFLKYSKSGNGQYTIIEVVASFISGLGTMELN